MSGAKQTLNLLSVPLSFSFSWNAFPASSNHRHPASTSMQIQPLSKRVLLASANQRTRQRNMGIAKISCQGLWQLFGKEGCLEDLFFQQTIRNYWPCVSTPGTPEHHQEHVSQQKTVYHNSWQLFYPAILEENRINNNDLHCVLFWKSWNDWNGKKCIKSSTGLGEGWDWRASSWANFWILHERTSHEQPWPNFYPGILWNHGLDTCEWQQNEKMSKWENVEIIALYMWGGMTLNSIFLS